MQKDLFLSDDMSRLNELRARKSELAGAIKDINEEIYTLVKQGCSIHIGERSYLCVLPSGGTYFFTADAGGPTPKIQDFHAFDLGELELKLPYLKHVKELYERKKNDR